MVRFITFFTFERLVILFGVSVVLFFVLTFTAGFAWSWFFLLIILFLIPRYFILGSVGAAGRYLQESNFEMAKKALSWTWKPEWLRFGMHGTYYFLKSVIAQNDKDNASAEKFLVKCLALGLPDDESTTMAHLNLAGMYFQKNNRNEAKIHYEKAKKLKPTNPMLVDILNQMEKGINAPKIPQYQQQMMQRGGRGFRR